MDAVDRPQMPAGYGLASDDGGRLTREWAEERLTAARNYWLCTTRSDGRPHAMPVWGLWLDGAVFFSTDPDSTKGRNLAARPDVIVHLESGDEVVVVDGRAEYLAGPDLPAEFVDAYDEKYGHRLNGSDPGFGFYRVHPARILAWRESDFPTSATRFNS
jgi:nitroimidazol reductase NimA-like FMN-containing flavoprotein (pyridoxamine 5'-phosphate oxidase superfamily)